MLYRALASDYDGTLATDGEVDPTTIEALQRFKATGKRLILITGRELEDLRAAFPDIGLFDVVVAENGALLYFPATQESRSLAASPPEELIAALRAKRIDPLSVGRSVIATWTPNEGAVLDAIRELGLDWQLTFNKGAVMCLPPGINKGSGLAAALDELKLSRHNVVGVGDAENDQAFLSTCGCAVAVANAIDAVKDSADLRTRATRGAGVAELIAGWLSDPSTLFSAVRKHDIPLGEVIGKGTTVSLPSDRGAVLITGVSGVGKTALTHLLVERMGAGGYQVCIVDPEGDYDGVEHVTHLGDTARTPAPEDVMSVLDSPRASVTVNLLGIDVPERPAYFHKLMGQLSGLRASTGRPHWLILDETHHLAPNTDDPEHTALPDNLSSAVFITTRPQNLSQSALGSIGTVIAVGEAAGDVLAEFSRVAGGIAPPSTPPISGDAVLIWEPGAGQSPRAVAVAKARHTHRRHTRKYAQGRLGEDKSFYFRGPTGSLNLRAFNLATFLQLAEGVDDDTWLHHLKRGDYSAWFKDDIKDEALASEIRQSESSQDAAESRAAIAKAIKRRYAVVDVQ
jgi:hydroxymethylpyrimidine pyrophosphatase-like HAD family hydrolase